MRASRSVGKKVAQGLRSLASKAKGSSNGAKPGAAAASKPAAPAAPASATPAPPKAAPADTKPAAAAAATAPAAAGPAAATKPSAAAAAAAAPKAPPAASAVPAAPGSSAAAGATDSGGSWKIHPAVPVDARLLGAGIAGAGLLLYNLTSGGGEQQQPQPEEAAEGGSAQQAEQQQGEEAEAHALADVAPQHVDEGFHVPQQQQQAGEQQPGGQPEQAAAVAEQEEEVTYVDGSQVLSVINEVLTTDASQLLQQAGAAGAQAASPEGPKPAGSAKPEAAGAKPKAKKGAAAAAAAKAAEVVNEELAAVQVALADSAADALASEVGKAVHKPAPAAAPKPAPQEAPPLPPPEPMTLPELGPHVAQASSALAGLDPLVKQVLGLEQDVTPAGLIAAAARHGQGAGEDWVQYRHRHRQAVSDAQFIVALLESAAKNVKSTLDAKDRAIAERQEQADAARAALRRQGDQFRELLKAALDDADKQAKAALKLQSQQLAVAHAEMSVRERKDRLAEVDKVRVKLAALEAALQRRAFEQRSATSAHQMAMGAFALQSALESGQPLTQAVQYLSKACKSDELITAALAAIPASVAERGVWSRVQIAEAFHTDVRRIASQLGWVPEGQGGFLTITLAKLASKLKIEERGPVAASVAGGGVDHSLAVVGCQVADGQLLAAAEELEAAVRSTAAAGEVANWVAQVRARVLAEQTLALLEAHASTLSVSLA